MGVIPDMFFLLAIYVTHGSCQVIKTIRNERIIDGGMCMRRLVLE
jgi:hypothetical protein